MGAHHSAELGLETRRPPRRALYLASRTPLRVLARDDSLVVERRSAACQRFPAARVDRIVCNAAAEWSGAALALCLRWGITITWLDAEGHALGDCVPRQSDTLPLNAALERLVELVDWPERYGNWLRRRRMAVLLRWAIRRKQAANPVDAGQWSELRRQWVYGAQIETALDPALQGWCRCLVVARLTGAGLRTRYPGFAGHCLELGEDMTALLWAELALESGALASRAGNSAATALMFEAGAHVRVHHLHEHLGQLQRFAIETIETWF